MSGTLRRSWVRLPLFPDLLPKQPASRFVSVGRSLSCYYNLKTCHDAKDCSVSSQADIFLSTWRPKGEQGSECLQQPVYVVIQSPKVLVRCRLIPVT